MSKMNSGKIFAAPWSVLLKLMTLMSVIVLGSLPVFGLFNYHENMHPGLVFMIFVLPALILCGSIFFLIKGYQVSNGILLIHRLGWKTKLDLSDLESATSDPDAMKKSIRTFGNGGLFSFSGKYRNRKLGPYRAFATNPELSVILRFPGRVVIVTPESPTEFVRMLERVMGHQER